MKTAQRTVAATANVDLDAVPAHESDAICRTLIGCVSRFFENPAIMNDYKRWKQERQREKEQNYDI